MCHTWKAFLCARKIHRYLFPTYMLPSLFSILNNPQIASTDLCSSSYVETPYQTTTLIISHLFETSLCGHCFRTTRTINNPDILTSLYHMPFGYKIWHRYFLPNRPCHNTTRCAHFLCIAHWTLSNQFVFIWYDKQCHQDKHNIQQSRLNVAAVIFKPLCDQFCT